MVSPKKRTSSEMSSSDGLSDVDHFYNENEFVLKMKRLKLIRKVAHQLLDQNGNDENLPLDHPCSIYIPSTSMPNQKSIFSEPTIRLLLELPSILLVPSSISALYHRKSLVTKIMDIESRALPIDTIWDIWPGKHYAIILLVATEPEFDENKKTIRFCGADIDFEASAKHLDVVDVEITDFKGRIQSGDFVELRAAYAVFSDGISYLFLPIIMK
ncbi:hypothetical protein WR25_13583 [Diploscapter pachys]|uniref:Uncharacterized protein n=1 Tax=Diploscapter pachys TaxID=2018661 RepID=A0A2A2LCI1_9BILA|nr:hypothetical protein WR25_13583 [Diploscapter pachys]